MTYPITVKGQLSSVEAFRHITLNPIPQARLQLSDVARIESGLQSYAYRIRENGIPARRQPQSSCRRGRRMPSCRLRRAAGAH